MRHVLTAEPNPSRVQAQKPDHELERHRLAGPAPSEDREGLPALHLEIEPT